MIGRLTGTLIEKMPPTICLDVGGVGYEIDVPMSTLYGLPDTGAKVTLFIHLTVREDAHILYGFASAQERATFRALIKVTGIGARTALAVLSGMSTEELADAVKDAARAAVRSDPLVEAAFAAFPNAEMLDESPDGRVANAGGKWRQ